MGCTVLLKTQFIFPAFQPYQLGVFFVVGGGVGGGTMSLHQFTSKYNR